MAEPNMTEPNPPAPDLTTLDPATPATATPAPAPLFSGVGVALVTLFDADGEIDPGSTGKLAARLAGRGMAGGLGKGTTGGGGAPRWSPCSTRTARSTRARPASSPPAWPGGAWRRCWSTAPRARRAP